VILYGTGPFLLRIYETALATSEKPLAYCTEPIEPSPTLPIPHLEGYQPEIFPEVPVFLALLDNTFGVIYSGAFAILWLRRSSIPPPK
jgi:hypothetical protein